MVVHRKMQFPCDTLLFPIGQGKLTEIRFSGAVKRLQFELETLTGARPVMPALSYGQRFAKIACTEQSFSASSDFEQLKVGDTRYLALSHYHVLEPSALKFITLVNCNTALDGAIKTGKELATASHGTFVLLGVAEDDSKTSETQKLLQDLIEKVGDVSEFRLEKQVREGRRGRSLLLEVQEGYYDVAILERYKNCDGSADKKLTQLVRRLLVSAGIPVLISNTPARTMEKILICTAGGEPGKNDVRFGARIARHLKSAVTVFHVLRANADEEHKKHIAKYLEQAAAMINAYDLKCDLRIGKGAPVDSIVKEIQEGNFGLTVVGAPEHYNEASLELIRRIVNETSSSVLVVPASE